MKLICTVSQQIFHDDFYFIKDKIYESSIEGNTVFIEDEDGYEWQFNTIPDFFTTLKEQRKQKLIKIQNA